MSIVTSDKKSTVGAQFIAPDSRSAPSAALAPDSRPASATPLTSYVSDAHSAIETLMPRSGNRPAFIRAYQVTDYPQVLALWQEANLRPFLEQELERLLGSGGGALVAVVPQANEGGKAGLNGTEAAVTAGHEAPLTDTVVGIVLWSHNGSVGILWRLAVAEQQRGRGIATKLLDRAEQDIRAAGFSGVTLLTRVTNTVAKSMYARRGYKWNDHLEFWGKKLPDLMETLDLIETPERMETNALPTDMPATCEEQTSC